MLNLSVNPNTLEQVESSIVDWFLSKGEQAPFKFSRTPGTSNRLCLFPTLTSDVKLKTKDQFLFIEVKKFRLTINLDKFVITTAFEDHRFCLNIEPDPRSEHRFLDSALRDVADTRHPIFISRGLRVLKSLEEDLSNARIDEATAARTDYEVVLDALNASPRIGELISEDPLAAAKLRGLKRKQQMLELAGGSLTSEQVAEVLGISRQAVDKRRGSNQLLALTQGKRGYGYPSFQFEDGKTLQGLKDVLKELETLDPWMQLIFFSNPNDRLDGATPIKALRRGRVEDVIQAARGYGDQGAA